MIDLDRKSLETVRRILRVYAPDCRVVVFGSRVGKGRAQRFSDLDLALKSERDLDWQEVEKLKDAFAESDLPFTVDVVDLKKISETFRGIIIGTGELL